MNPVKEMIRRPATYLLVAVLGLAVPAAAQTPLTLTEAIARARAQNPDAGSSAAVERETVQRIRQARAGYLPKVDVSSRGSVAISLSSSSAHCWPSASSRLPTSRSAHSTIPTPSTTFARR